ncbi:hypothetical protein KW782_02815 [Candidatus Parcubacteria bacterium]|nr:hypothetical protein [Candidatus Parcubacteria bacterium]
MILGTLLVGFLWVSAPEPTMVGTVITKTHESSQSPGMLPWQSRSSGPLWLIQVKLNDGYLLKAAIDETSFHKIDPGDTVYLDGGTTSNIRVSKIEKKSHGS